MKEFAFCISSPWFMLRGLAVSRRLFARLHTWTSWTCDTMYCNSSHWVFNVDLVRIINNWALHMGRLSYFISVLSSRINVLKVACGHTQMKIISSSRDWHAWLICWLCFILLVISFRRTIMFIKTSTDNYPTKQSALRTRHWGIWPVACNVYLTKFGWFPL